MSFFYLAAEREKDKKEKNSKNVNIRLQCLHQVVLHFNNWQKIIHPFDHYRMVKLNSMVN